MNDGNCSDETNEENQENQGENAADNFDDIERDGQGTAWDR